MTRIPFPEPGARSGALARHAATWLSLAAAPVFGFLAVLTAVNGSGPDVTLCSATPGAAPHGMAFMYGLMSVFHAAPWLRLLGPSVGGVRR